MNFLRFGRSGFATSPWSLQAGCRGRHPQATGKIGVSCQRSPGNAHLLAVIRCCSTGGSAGMAMDLGAMRKAYRDGSDVLTEASLVADREPYAQFKAWFAEAEAHPGIYEANSMVLATASKDTAAPSARVVLLKGFGKDLGPALKFGRDEEAVSSLPEDCREGFVFFTNYQSRKGHDLEDNPQVALTFYWEPLKRSVRIEGTAAKLDEATSEAYFKSRPLGSQIGALVSNQSSVIPFGRTYLSDKEAELKAKCDKEGLTQLDKPSYWGGFCVRPRTFEFWQGQSTRIHDRFRFSRAEDRREGEQLDWGSRVEEGMALLGEAGWVIERLAP